jgi:hypothetical protein
LPFRRAWCVYQKSELKNDSLYSYAPRDWIGSDVNCVSIAGGGCGWTGFHRPDYYWQVTVLPVPVPALSFDDTKLLAKEFVRLQNVETSKIASVLELQAFQFGLADTAGLPGLVGMLCSKGMSVAGSYSEILHTAVTSYTSGSAVDWRRRWPSLATLVLTRPYVTEDTVIEGEYTVGDARDSGTILFQDNEIGVLSAL